MMRCGGGCCCSYELMRRCWLYGSKSRPTFFDILRDFELEMSDKFREMSFYFNQDVGDAASLSDDCDAAADDDLEREHLTKPSSELDSNVRNTRDSPRSRRDRSVSSDYLPGRSDTAVADVELTDRLLAPSGDDRTVSRDVIGALSAPVSRNSGNASSDVDVEADTVHRKELLRNGHIPYKFMTTARC